MNSHQEKLNTLLENARAAIQAANETHDRSEFIKNMLAEKSRLAKN